jgi:hypothetical protein
MVPMRIFNGFDEIKSAVGTEIGVSDWIEVTQDRINRFADATCDEQWIHVDQERAKKELPGGTTIAHGLLSLALTPMFIRSVIGLKGLKNTLNYGADRIRYLSQCRRDHACAAVSASPRPRKHHQTDYGSITAWRSRSRAASGRPASPSSSPFIIADRANAIHEQAPPGGCQPSRTRRSSFPKSTGSNQVRLRFREASCRRFVR